MMFQARRSATLLFFAAVFSAAAAGVTGLAGGSAAAGGRPAGAARVFAVRGGWGTAQEVPGIAGFAVITSVSCTAAGACSAGGFFSGGGGVQAFAVSQRHGVWGQAEEVPGIAALNQGGNAQISSVSCTAAGTCGAGGTYVDGSGRLLVFVVSQRHGIWGRAEELPGIAALSKGEAHISSVSCGAAGACSAGGDYSAGGSETEVFVVSERHGVWGRAEEVPGIAALNQRGLADLFSVSCGAAGSCSAGGDYVDGLGRQKAFVVSQVHGTWGRAEQVPGLAALNQGEIAAVKSVSCAAAGACSAGGSYTDRSGRGQQAFVVSQRHGTWGQAEEVPGTAALNQGGLAHISSVSCTTAGTCSAGGFYKDRSGGIQAFAVSQRHGTWGQAEETPGTAALNQGGNAGISSVSCTTAGTCDAGGFYTDRSGGQQVFVVSQRHGTWGQAEEVPGTAALNQGGFADLFSVSCGAAGTCSAGGEYTNRLHGPRAFVVSKT